MWFYIVQPNTFPEWSMKMYRNTLDFLEGKFNEIMFYCTGVLQLSSCGSVPNKSQSLFVWSLPAFKASAFALPWPTDRHAWTAVMAMAPGLHPEAGGWRRKNWHDFKEWTRDFWVMFGATRQQLGFWLAGIVRLLASDDASKFCSTC